MSKFRETRIGNCTLYCGDCWEVIDTLKQIKFTIVTDPPYGIKQHHGAGLRTRERFIDDPVWDNEAPNVRPLLDMMDYAVIWGGNYFELPPSRKYIVWSKPLALPSMADCEMAWCSWDGNARLIEYKHNEFRKGEFSLCPKIHPTQKPVAVMEFCLKELPDSEFPILDPYMGSGTTAVAMTQLGMNRKFIGIEKEPKYFEMACRRIQEAINQQNSAR